MVGAGGAEAIMADGWLSRLWFLEFKFALGQIKCSDCNTFSAARNAHFQNNSHRRFVTVSKIKE